MSNFAVRHRCPSPQAVKSLTGMDLPTIKNCPLFIPSKGLGKRSKPRFRFEVSLEYVAKKTKLPIPSKFALPIKNGLNQPMITFSNFSFIVDSSTAGVYPGLSTNMRLDLRGLNGSISPKVTDVSIALLAGVQPCGPEMKLEVTATPLHPAHERSPGPRSIAIAAC